MERRKVEVESWSPPAVVCGILRRRAANSASNNNNARQMELLAVTNRRNRRHLTPTHPVRHLRTSSPLAPRPYATRVACICQPADRQTDGAPAENNQMGSSLGSAVVNCFNREKETHAPSRRLVADVLPNLLTPTDKRMSRRTERKDGRTDERTAE